MSLWVSRLPHSTMISHHLQKSAIPHRNGQNGLCQPKLPARPTVSDGQSGNPDVAYLHPSSTLYKVYFAPSRPTRQGLRFNGCIEEAQRLWDEYMSGIKLWDHIVQEAHSREVTGRAALLQRWNIRPSDYQAKVNEDVIVRTGTDPAKFPGRGEFSDEDLTANTLNAWRQLQKSAKEAHLSILHDKQAGFFRIPELNTVVWKPNKPVSFKDQHRFFSHVKTMITHPEVVDPSSNNPRFSMEYVLSMINKAQKGLCEPVEKWGNSYNGYETLIQLAKSTHHALEKTGLAQQYPNDCNRLWALCKMHKSPEELGIFKPGDTQAEILNGFKREQARMQTLMAESFEKARQDLKKPLQELKAAFTPDPRAARNTATEAKQAVHENLEDTYQRLIKIKIQLDVLSQSQNHAPFISRLFNSPVNARRKSFHEFQDQLQREIEFVSNMDKQVMDPGSAAR